MAGTIRVLYVDDETGLLDIGKRFLEKEGAFAVDTLISVEAALEQLKTERYDAIISDYQMPDLDGIAFLKQLKASGNITPFIIFTGKGREEVVIEALNEGADFYLQKGGEPKAQFAELAHKIRSAVMRKHAEAELLKKNEELNASYEQIAAGEEELRANLDELISQERALRETEQRYRNIVEDQTEFICRFLPNGTHIFVNEAYCRYFGVAREDIIGHTFRPVLYADDREAVSSFFATLTQKDPVGTIDHRIIMQDGSIRWQRWSDRAIFDNKGDVVEYQSVGRDITEQKAAEAAIKQSEAQLTAIIQGSPIPKFVIDKDHRVIHWNKALEAYSGILEKEIIGTKQHWRAFYKEVRPCLADLLLDGGVEEIPGWYAGKYAKSKLIEGAYEATDFFPHMGKTGIWLFFTASVIKDDEGNTLGAVETLENITETHFKTEELKEAYQKMQAAFDQAKLSEERYRNVVEDQTEFISRFYPDGTHVFVNEAYCRYFGKSRDDIIGHIFRPVIPKEDRLKLKEHFRSLSPQNPVAMVEHRITMQDGSECWQRWSERAIFDNEGVVIEYQSVGRDITNIKNAEIELNRSHEELSAAYEQIAAIEEELRSNYNELAEEQNLLRESENRYRNVVEDQTEFISRFLPDGTHIFVNEAYCRCFGKTSDEIIGRIFVPDIPEKDQVIVRQHFQSLTPENPVATVAHRIVMPDGSVQWHRWSDRAIFDETGSIVEYQSVGRDITEQKLVEEALRNSEKILEGIIEHLPDPTLVINMNGEVIAWNRALEVLTGTKASDMLGKGDYEYSIPLYGVRRPILIDLALTPDEELLKTYRVVKREGETLVGETLFAQPQGKKAVLWGKASPLYDKFGTGIGAVESIRDITERTKEEEKFRLVNKQLNLLTGITRHDINNQLLVLKGYLEVSSDYLDDPIRLKEFINREMRAATTIEEQIAFTREFQDMGAKPPVWQSLPAVIEQEKKRLHPGDIDIETDCIDQEILADSLFEKVIYNLVDNALKYGGDTMTKIRFFSYESGGDLIVVCQDNGEGVPGKDKSRVFDQGYGKHTGLGLYLSREILSLTGITIAETGEPGKGARFEMKVPKGAWRMTGDGA